MDVHVRNSYLHVTDDAGGLLVAYGGGNGELPDRSAHLSLLHIASIESLTPA